MMRVFLLAVLLALYAVPSALAWDAGIILGQTFNIFGYEGGMSEEDDNGNYNGNGDGGGSMNITRRTSVVPWFTASLGARAEVYLSAGLSLEYPADGWSLIDEVQLVPEVFRFELSFAPSDTLGVSLGRVPFRDSLGWVIGGLFDGVSLSSTNPWGRIDAGVFYTGLLYKDAVSINLSPHDSSTYNGYNRYFASRRIVGSLSWEQPGIFDTRSSLRLGGLAQADLNYADVAVHSQYLLVGTTMSFGRGFSFDMGTALSLTQDVQEFDMNMYPALAASLDFRWQHSGLGTVTMPGMLSLGGKVASGEWGAIGVFVPFSGPTLGRVLLPEFSGLAMVRAAYIVRVHRAVLELFFACLLRTDTVTFTDGLYENSDSLLLGWEAFLSLSWAPFPDLIFMLDGGFFLPMPAAFGPGAAHLGYRLELMAVFSL